MIVSIVSGKGAPGASTTALAMTLCWPRPVLLIEADPAGGGFAFGYAAGVDLGGRNLTGVRVTARRTDMADAIWANVVTLGDARWLLPGIETPRQAEAVDYAQLASALPGLGVDVIVDAGRIPAAARHDPIWVAADTVMVVMRSTLPAVHAAQAAAILARDVAGLAGPGVRSVIVGPGRPYAERDIRVAMADVAPVTGTIAWDPGTAALLVDAAPAGRGLATSPLMRSAARLARRFGDGPEPIQESARHATAGTAAGHAAERAGATTDRPAIFDGQASPIPIVAAADGGGAS